jgi:predicted RNA-binding protein with EMAP domain
MKKENKLIEKFIFVLDEKARRGTVDMSWEGFQNGNGVEVGKDIEKLIKQAKKILKNMKKIFRCYINNMYNTVDIKVVADNKEQAIEIILQYIEKSPEYDENYWDKQKVGKNTSEYFLNESEILSDESSFSDLGGHFD